MNRFKTITKTLCALAAAVIIVGGGADACDEKVKVAECKELNNDSERCNKAEQNDGKKCSYDEAAKKCIVKPETSSHVEHCAKMNNDEEKCQDDIKCTWNSVAPTKCEEAATGVKDTCAAYERQAGCDGKKDTANNDCEWDATAATPVCKQKGGGPGPRSFSYFEMTFAPANAGMVVDTSKLISAIGTNGDKSRIYLAANDKKGKLGSVKPDGSDASDFDIKHGGPNAVGKRDLTVGAGEVFAIIPGPAGTDKVIAAVKGVTTVKGGVLEVSGKNTVDGAWNSDKTDLSATVDNNKDISAITTFGNFWIAFQNEAATTGAYHNTTKAAAIAKGGPNTGTPALGVVITAAISKGADMYMAYTGKVHRFTPGASPSTNLVVFGGDANNKEIVKAADLVMSGGVANNDISALGMVGPTLIVGLNGANNVNKGGFAVVDFTNAAAPVVTKPDVAFSQWDVVHIAVSSDDKTAIITTSKGPVFYHNGKSVKIENATVAAKTVAAASQAIPLAFTNAIGTATSLDLDHAKVGAVHIGNTWFLATDNEGVYPLVTTEKTKQIP